MSSSSGCISLPKEMDFNKKSVNDKQRAFETTSRLTSTKVHTSGIFSRLASMMHRNDRPHSAQHSREGSESLDALKEWGGAMTLPMKTAGAPLDVFEDSPSPPSSPGTPESSSKKSRGSTRSRLRKLRDIDGLDSPTIVRCGSSSTKRIDASSTTDDNSCMQKSTSVPDLKSVHASSIASRRQKVPELKSVSASKIASRRWEVPESKSVGAYSTDVKDAGDPMQSRRHERILQHYPGFEMEDSLIQPNSPMTPDSGRTSKRRDSLGNRLAQLRDFDGLDSPTIRRRGSDIFAESPPNSYSGNGSFRRRSSSVSDFSVTSSNVAARRERRENLSSYWRTELSNDVYTLMKVDPSMSVNDFRANVSGKIYKSEADPIDDSPKGSLRHTKSYRHGHLPKRASILIGD